MRFKIGLAVGLALGYWAGTTPADERRAKVEEVWGGVRGNPRVQRLTETVSTDVRRLGDAVQQRFSSTTDSAIDTVAQDAGSSTEPAGAPDTSRTSGPGDGRSTTV
jgi:hypothetical protein